MSKWILIEEEFNTEAMNVPGGVVIRTKTGGLGVPPTSSMVFVSGARISHSGGLAALVPLKEEEEK